MNTVLASAQAALPAIDGEHTKQPNCNQTASHCDLPPLPLDAAALQRRLEELRQIDEPELHVINLPIVDVVCASLAAAATVERLLPRLRQLPSFKVELATALHEWAYILQHADAQVKLDTGPAPVPKAPIDEGLQLRRSFKREVGILQSRGIIADARLRTVTSSKGYAKLANDLLTFVHVLQDTQSSWLGKSALCEEELARARAVARTIQRAVRERSEWQPSPWHDLRVRAFTMVRRAHAEARAAVQYLLRDDPRSMDLIPLLAHARSRSRKRRGHCASRQPMRAGPTATSSYQTVRSASLW